MMYTKSQVSFLRCVCNAGKEGLVGGERQAGKEHLARGEIHQGAGAYGNHDRGAEDHVF